MGVLLIIIPPGSVVILKCGIFMGQDGAMAAPILPFKRTEAGWTCMLLSRCEKNGLFTAQKDFYGLKGWTKNNNSLGVMSPKGLKTF